MPNHTVLSKQIKGELFIVCIILVYYLVDVAYRLMLSISLPNTRSILATPVTAMHRWWGESLSYVPSLLKSILMVRKAYILFPNEARCSGGLALARSTLLSLHHTTAAGSSTCTNTHYCTHTHHSCLRRYAICCVVKRLQLSVTFCLTTPPHAHQLDCSSEVTVCCSVYSVLVPCSQSADGWELVKGKTLESKMCYEVSVHIETWHFTYSYVFIKCVCRYITHSTHTHALTKIMYRDQSGLPNVPGCPICSINLGLWLSSGDTHKTSTYLLPHTHTHRDT